MVKLFLLLTLVIDGIGDNRLESKGEGSLFVPLQEDLQIREIIYPVNGEQQIIKTEELGKKSGKFYN